MVSFGLASSASNGWYSSKGQFHQEASHMSMDAPPYSSDNDPMLARRTPLLSHPSCLRLYTQIKPIILEYFSSRRQHPLSSSRRNKTVDRAVPPQCCYVYEPESERSANPFCPSLRSWIHTQRQLRPRIKDGSHLLRAPHLVPYLRRSSFIGTLRPVPWQT